MLCIYIFVVLQDLVIFFFFFFQAEDGIRDYKVTGVQTCALPICVIDPQGTAARPLYQTEGLLYMSYVQAAVYDAATKIGHRYAPYHRFSARAGNASLQAAVIAAAYNTLVFYLGDPGGTLTAKYAASIAALPDDRTTARGIAVGQAAAADIEAL